MGMHSKKVRGSAVTATARASPGTITIPAGKGGTLVAIQAISYGTLETGVLGAGGLVELENDSVDWKPCEFYTDMPQELTATSGGFVYQRTTMIKGLNKALPENSIVTVYFTPYDDQSQELELVIFWIRKGFSGRQTYLKTGKGTAITQVTKQADHVQITIPKQKGGRLKAVFAVGQKIAAVVVGTDPNFAGGTVSLRNESAELNWEPLEFSTGAPSGLVAGAYVMELERMPMDADLPGNSTVDIDYTPANNASQYLLVTLIWE